MKLVITLVVTVVACDGIINISAFPERNDGNHPGVVPHIIGGNKVDLSEQAYPIWITTYKNTKTIRQCQGARFSDMWFITAAECLDRNSYPYDQARVIYSYYSQHRILYEGYSHFKHRIHPEYNNVTKENNIALIKCGNCFDADQTLFPILPSQSDQFRIFTQKPAVVSAWIGDSASHLWKVNTFHTKVIDPFWCRLFKFIASDEINQICVSGWFHKGLSKSDTGAPLVIKEDNALKLVGIASSVRPWAGTFSLPMVFTQVSHYIKWIHKETLITLQD